MLIPDSMSLDHGSPRFVCAFCLDAAAFYINGTRACHIHRYLAGREMSDPSDKV